MSVARSLFGETDVELARALEALGHVHHSMSKFTLAEEAFGEAELIRIRLGLEHDAEWVRLLHSVATNLRAEQRFEDAIKYHLRAEAGRASAAGSRSTQRLATCCKDLRLLTASRAITRMPSVMRVKRCRCWKVRSMKVTTCTPMA